VRAGPAAPRRAVAAAAAAALLAACGGGAEVPPRLLEGSRPVSFRTDDGVRLAGRLFGEGRTGVVLAHMLPADQSSWFPFARELAQRGYLVLTFDFRGYCPGGDAGCSEGEREIAEIWRDVEAAVAFLRARGASRVALVGASMGGTASLVAASHLGEAVAAVVALSAPVEIEGLAAERDVLAGVVAPTLLVAGERDGTAAEAAEALGAGVAGPARVEILPGGEHGTELLRGELAGRVRALLLEHLERYAAP